MKLINEYINEEYIPHKNELGTLNETSYFKLILTVHGVRLVFIIFTIVPKQYEKYLYSSYYRMYTQSDS